MITDIDDYVSVTRTLRSKFGTGKERAQNAVNRVSHALFLFRLSEKLMSL